MYSQTNPPPQKKKSWTLHFSFAPSCTHTNEVNEDECGGTVLLTSRVSNCGPVLQGHGGKDKQGEDRNRSDEEEQWESRATWERVGLMQCQSQLLTLGGSNCMWGAVKAVIAEREMSARRGGRRRRAREKIRAKRTWGGGVEDGGDRISDPEQWADRRHELRVQSNMEHSGASTVLIHTNTHTNRGDKDIPTSCETEAWTRVTNLITLESTWTLIAVTCDFTWL